MTSSDLVRAAVVVAVASPGALLIALGVSALLIGPVPERLVRRSTSLAMFVSVTGLAVALAAYALGDARSTTLTAGTWFSSGEGRFQFDFLLDSWSLGFALLSATVCGVVAAFSARYLHLDPGFTRYFVLFTVFVLGILLVALAGSIEVLFAGWELLGLSSALLVAFFHQRPTPVANGLYVFAVYRIGDAAMLIAAVLLHFFAGSGSLSLLFSSTGTTAGRTLSESEAVLICAFLLTAVAVKSALLPFSSWLPRAMEGPTPSSAVYYGALSIHAGCFLLLRSGPLLEQSAVAQWLAASAGAGTALYATAAARVHPDVKSALAYASLTQVGIIILEISMELYTLAFIHMVGHASFRVLQFLTAPNVLRDLHELEVARKGGLDGAATASPGRWEGLRRTIFLIALERGFLDAGGDRWVVAPFSRWISALNRLDRALAGQAARTPDEPVSTPQS